MRMPPVKVPEDPRPHACPRSLNRFESLLPTVQRGKDNAAGQCPEHERNAAAVDTAQQEMDHRFGRTEESINTLKRELTKMARMPTERTFDATICTRRVQTGNTGNTLRSHDLGSGDKGEEARRGSWPSDDQSGTVKSSRNKLQSTSHCSVAGSVRVEAPEDSDVLPSWT